MGNFNCIKKWNIFICPVVIACAFCVAYLSGCGEEDASAGWHVEYVGKDDTKIVSVAYEPVAEDTDGQVAELLAMLSADSGEVEYHSAISGDVALTGYERDGYRLDLYFNAAYADMGVVEEVLCRAAIVRTLTQVSGVNRVTFYVDGEPLCDADGNLVGSMTADSFVENPGEQINSIQDTTLTLYFANEDGDALVKEVRSDVYYSSNLSMDKLVIEQLMDGPEIEGAQSVFPDGTHLVTASTVDGICYVNLDEAFKNQNYAISEAVVIYAIVDSLTELPTVDQVQISINGDTSGVYRDTFALSEMYEQNLDYVIN